jgi:exosortase
MSDVTNEEGLPTLGEFSKLPRLVHVLIGAVIVALLGIYFVFPAYPTVYGKSLAGWTWLACNSVNGFLHGRLVPLIFPWMIWWVWKEKKDELIVPSYRGLLFIGVALLLFLISMPIVQPRYALVGAPFLVIGLAHYLFGWRIAKAVIFPAFFLWFAIPVPGLERLIMGNWQVAITQLSYEVGNALGMDLVLNGGTIKVGDSSMNIAEG